MDPVDDMIRTKARKAKGTVGSSRVRRPPLFDDFRTRHRHGIFGVLTFMCFGTIMGMHHQRKTGRILGAGEFKKSRTNETGCQLLFKSN